ncbi:MAG: hypothetical protein Ct9H90mP2_07970 [Dehalococcoidia bacterium]|nr:MAG: hypothetical protein Ct9H90mP2_07970 [Dehalococcoidia bacterium]
MMLMILILFMMIQFQGGPGNFIIGGNILDKHYKNFNISRDLGEVKILDIAEAKEGFISLGGSD